MSTEDERWIISLVRLHWWSLSPVWPLTREIRHPKYQLWWSDTSRPQRLLQRISDYGSSLIVVSRHGVEYPSGIVPNSTHKHQFDLLPLIFRSDYGEIESKWIDWTIIGPRWGKRSHSLLPYSFPSHHPSLSLMSTLYDYSNSLQSSHHL